MRLSRPRKDVLLAFSLSLVTILAVELVSRGVPLLRANLLAVVAAVFLWVPSMFIARDDDRDRYSASGPSRAKSLGWALGFAALTFVGFLPGYHLWATRALDQAPSPDWGAYAHMSDRYYGDPGHVDDHAVHIYQFNDIVHVSWTPEASPWSLEVQTDGALLPVPNDGERVPAMRWRGARARPVHGYFATRGGSELVIVATERGAPLPPERFALGPGSEAPAASARLLSERAVADGDGVRVPLSARWILFSILVQLLLVALPEEYFYRGYLQRRLDEPKPTRRWTLGPLHLSPAILVVSAAFALGHFVIGWHPSRLAVFFPSLAFGFLRDKTDGLLAPILYHALCNLMVQVVSVHYITVAG